MLELKDAKDEHVHGGKAAMLAKLLDQGINIPDGIVLPAHYLHQHLEKQGLYADAKSLLERSDTPIDEELDECCHTIKDAVMRQNIDAELVRETEQFAPNQTYVVRSSAIGEDGARHSFAGQYTSCNHISGAAALEQAIRHVWSSLYDPNAIRYARQCKTSITDMSVLIQKQVKAVVSGVLFTLDPASPGSHTVMVEWCEGLADSLVAGTITPNSLQVPRESVQETDAYDLDELHTVQRRLHDPIDLTQSFLELVDTALNIEKSLGYPVDIEWCIDKTGAVWIVQCRPITSLYDAPLEAWSNANIAENYPEAVVPLLASFLIKGYAGYFRSLAKVFGVSANRVETHSEVFESLVGFQQGRPYYNLTSIVTILHLVPGGKWLASTFNLFTGASATPNPVAETGSSHIRRTIDAVRGVASIVAHLPTIERRLRVFEQRIDAYAKTTDPSRLNTLSVRELHPMLVEFLDIRVNGWGNAALADTSAAIGFSALGGILNRWAIDDHSNTHSTNTEALRNTLLQGLPGLESAKPVEALWDIAVLANHDFHSRQLILNTTPESLLAVLAEECPTLSTQLNDWFNLWGFRYSGELQLIRPTPAENPLPVLKLLKTYVADGQRGPAEISAERAEQRYQATKNTADLLSHSGLFRAWLFRRMLAFTHQAICWRERARMKQALLYTRLRHVSLALGDIAKQQGVLNQSDDIFFLNMDEAKHLASELGETNAEHNIQTTAKEPRWLESLNKIVMERRETWRVQRSTTPSPDEMTLPQGVSWIRHKPPVISAADSLNTLQGTPACAGEATGKAAVVLDVAEIDTVNRDAILVTRQTDPGWAPVFFLTRGLVIERGGQLSHGAIIAREYGIPAVVGVKGATTHITTNENLSIDGVQGLVRRLDV